MKNIDKKFFIFFFNKKTSMEFSVDLYFVNGILTLTLLNTKSKKIFITLSLSEFNLKKTILIKNNDVSFFSDAFVSSANDTSIILTIPNFAKIKLENNDIITIIYLENSIINTIILKSTNLIKIETGTISTIFLDSETHIVDELSVVDLYIDSNFTNYGTIKCNNLKTSKEISIINNGNFFTGKNFVHEKGSFINNGLWIHDGGIIKTVSSDFSGPIFDFQKFTTQDYDRASMMFRNEKSGKVIWKNAKLDHACSGWSYFRNYGEWTFDAIISFFPGKSIYIDNFGIVHLKNSELKFNYFINHGNLILSSGKYIIHGFQNHNLISFIENVWTFTDFFGMSVGPNYLFSDGYGPVGKIESEEDFYYYIGKKKFPDFITSCKSIYFPLHPNYSDQIMAKLENFEELQKILNKIKCSGSIEFTLINFELKSDLEITNIGHLILNLENSFTLTHFFKISGLNLKIKGDFVNGISETNRGILAATSGRLNIEANKIDNRFGKIYSSDKMLLKTLGDDIIVGNGIHKGPFLVGTNGSYISSSDEIQLWSSHNINCHYGQIFSAKYVFLSAKVKIANTAGEIISGGDICFITPDFSNTRDGVYNVATGPWTWAYHSCYNTCEISDEAKIQALGNIHFNCNKGLNMASSILANKNIFYRPYFENFAPENVETKKVPPSTFLSYGRENRKYGYNDKIGFTVGSVISTYSSTIKAGESITINTANFHITSNINSPMININASETGLFSGMFRHRNDTIHQETLILDMTEIIQKIAKKGGILKIKPKNESEEIKTDFSFEGPFLRETQICFFSSGKKQNLFSFDTFDPLAKLPSSLFDLFIQSALSDYAGRVDINSDKLISNAKKFHEENQNRTINRENIKNLTKSVLIRELQEATIKTLLCLASNEINPYQNEGDISGNEINVKTEKNQIHLNNRLVAHDLLNLTSTGGDIIRKTESYTVTSYIDGGIMHQDVAMPQQTLKCLNGDVNILAKKDIKSVGTKTEAGSDINEISESGNILSEPLILQTTILTEHESGEFLNKKTTNIETSFSAVLCENSAGKKIHKKALGTIFQTGTTDLAEESILYESENNNIETIVKTNTSSHFEETQGLSTTKTYSKYQENAVAFHSSIISPKITFRGRIGNLKGVFIQGQIIEDETDEGLNFEPIIAIVNYSQQIVINSPLASTDAGCRGGYEVVIPCQLMIEKIIRLAENGEIKFNSVDFSWPCGLEQKEIEILGRYSQTFYQPQNWHESWEISEQVIPDEVLMIGALAISYFTMGVGATLTGLTGLAGTMASAAFTTFCTTAATSFLRTGDFMDVGKNIFSKDFARNLAISCASAGLCEQFGVGSGLTPGLDAPFIDFLKTNLIRSAINAPLRCVIGRESIRDVFRSESINCLINTASMYAANQIGTRYFKEEVNYFEHKLLHGISGGITGALLNPKNIRLGILSGAIGSVIGEISGEENFFNIEDYQGRMCASKILAGTAAFLANQDVSTTIHVATNTIENNLLPCILAGLAAWSLAHETGKVLEASEKEEWEDFLYVLESDEVLLYSRDVAKGIWTGVESLVETFSHPLDNIVYPLGEFFSDIHTISSDYYRENNVNIFSMDSEYPRFNILNDNSKYDNVYDITNYRSILNDMTNLLKCRDAKMRMFEREKNIKNSFNRFFNASTSHQRVEKLSHIGTTFLLPGMAIKTAVNYTRFGMAFPPKFNLIEPAEITSNFRPVYYSFNDIRNVKQYQAFTYIVSEEGKILLSPSSANKPIFHPEADINAVHAQSIFGHDEIANFRPIFMAGDLAVENGLIKGINNRSGHYAPGGKHIGKLTQHVFYRNGYREINNVINNGKFSLIDDNFIDPAISYNRVNKLFGAAASASTELSNANFLGTSNSVPKSFKPSEPKNINQNYIPENKMKGILEMEFSQSLDMMQSDFSGANEYNK